MIKLVRVLFASALCLVAVNSWSQKADAVSEARKTFDQAEKHFIAERYSMALPLYINVDTILKDNANVAYKIGVCYLNSAIDKINSIPYLERAIKNTSATANEDAFKEKS